MAAVQVQKKEYFSTADATNHQIVLDSGPIENNLVIVFITHDGTLSTPPSGYTSAVSASDFIWGRIYYKIAGAGESATISIVLAGNEPCCIQAFEYSGMLTSGVLDVVASGIDRGLGTTIVSPTTATTTQARDLVFVSANMRMDVGGQTLTSWTNSFTIENECISTGSANVDMLLNVASKITSSAGTQQSTGTITTGGSGNDVALIATFKIANDPPVATVSWFRA